MDKRLSVEEEVGRTILLVTAKKKQKKNNHPLIIIYFETNPESKFQKDRKIAPTQTTKKVEVIGSLAKKFKLRVTVAKNKEGKKKNELSQGGKEWLENLLERADMTYTMPGRHDTVYIGMDYDKRQSVKKIPSMENS